MSPANALAIAALAAHGYDSSAEAYVAPTHQALLDGVAGPALAVMLQAEVAESLREGVADQESAASALAECLPLLMAIRQPERLPAGNNYDDIPF